MAEHIEGHLPCVKDGHHTCQRPSGRACIDCGAPAGTRWGPYWCPDCDSRRLARISAQFDDILAAISEGDGR